MTSEAATSASDVRAPRVTRFGFALVILLLILEYARPQDVFPSLAALRPSMVLGGLVVLAWMKMRSLHRAASPQVYRIVLMLLLILVHVPFAANNFWAYSVAVGFVLLLPLTISIVLFVDSIERLQVVAKWWTFLGAVIAARGIIGGGIAGSSFLADENDFSLLMNVMLPFAFCLFLYERRWSWKLVYLGTSLLYVVSIVVSGSRGGFVGLLAVGTVLWITSPRKVLSLLVAVLLGFAVYLAGDKAYWDDMSTIQNTDQGTAKQRFESWDAAWAMFKDNPLGVGPGNFPIRFPEYQPDSMQRNMWGRQAHSVWFTILAELGIPGALLYLSLLKANLRDIWFLKALKNSEQHRLAFFLSTAFLASLAGYFASGTFISVLYYPHYWYLSAMIVATRKIAEDRGNAAHSVPASIGPRER